jgi:hypothetical protein
MKNEHPTILERINKNGVCKIDFDYCGDYVITSLVSLKEAVAIDKSEFARADKISQEYDPHLAYFHRVPDSELVSVRRLKYDDETRKLSLTDRVETHKINVLEGIVLY